MGFIIENSTAFGVLAIAALFAGGLVGCGEAGPDVEHDLQFTHLDTPLEIGDGIARRTDDDTNPIAITFTEEDLSCDDADLNLGDYDKLAQVRVSDFETGEYSGQVQFRNGSSSGSNWGTVNIDGISSSEVWGDVRWGMTINNMETSIRGTFVVKNCVD